jgi:hypothetical protein
LEETDEKTETRISERIQRAGDQSVADNQPFRPEKKTGHSQ